MPRIVTEHIADWLAVRGVSRRDVSVKTGISEARLRRIIKGTAHRVTRHDMLRVANVLDILYEDLIKAPPVDAPRLTIVPKPRDKPYERWRVIYKLLEQRQMSLVTFAIKAGYSARYIQELLSGRKGVSPFVHRCFAEVLKIPLHELPLPERRKHDATQATSVSVRAAQQRI